MPTATHRDPRSIITPDAFEVSPELIGMPLASPRRRAAALAIDGMVIVGITALTRNFSLIVGVLAAGFFMRAGFRRTPVRGSVFGRAMRFSVGCLGVFIAIVTAALWSAFGIDFDRGGRPGSAALEVVQSANQLAQGVQAFEVLADVREARSEGDAVAAAVDAIGRAGELGVPDDAVREILVEAAPDSADWVAGWPRLVDSLLLAGRAGSAPEAPVDGTPEAELAGLSDAEVLDRYVALIREDEASQGADVPPASADARRYRGALERRVASVVAGDTIETLGDRLATLERRASSQEEELDEAERQLEAAENRGLFRRLLDVAEDLGFGFGWAALYMTVVLSWWKGQTVGKRALGIRVVRLDGEPITWWVAFERVGGYAAGVATGLLGFAQVWWDANRQAIHDRIVGTVVVRDGAEKVLDWESAL
jgi:hypothetical protein